MFVQVFVGGLPENMTEEIITEVFERCGEITTLRLSKKNFCHIRFVYEASVDAALFLSGYRIRIGSNTDPPNTGRLHVDYAQVKRNVKYFFTSSHISQLIRRVMISMNGSVVSDNYRENRDIGNGWRKRD